MKLKKSVLAIVVMMLCVMVLSQNVMAASSGSCGTSATWKFDNGTLTISGTGVVDSIPWMDAHKASITKVIIEEGIVAIDEKSAFSGCDNLASVSLPDSLTKLDFYAFLGCDSLKSITIPKNLVDAAYCFKSSGLETVTFAEGLTVVDGFMFQGSSNLKTVYFVDSIIEIGGSAFDGCEKLTNVVLPKNLEEIGMYAFKGCESIASITIPKTLADSGSNPFMGTGIETVTFEEGATEIPGNMFANCHMLKTVNMPQHIKKIGYSSFEDCDALTEITLPYYVEEIGMYAFKDCTNLKEITIYQKVDDIHDYAFKNVTGLTIYGKKNSEAHKFAKKQGYTFKVCKVPALKGITYTKGNLKYQVVTDYINGKGTVMVTGIKKSAASVTIPKTVKLENYSYKVVKINNNAFKGKSSLKKITIKSTYLTFVGKNAIKGINKNATIKVPKSKLKDYKKLFKVKTGYKKTMKITK
ncbi:MAG: leucine-rich repeat protein [Lachnospiraceae bacterium]|nr:leucine-rich repeat protein [Lachnospiraceae bacterium]